MSVRVGHRLEGRSRPPLRILLTTRLGWWAAGLGTAFLPLVFAAGIVPARQRSAFSAAWRAELLGWSPSCATESVRLPFCLLVPLVIAVAFLLVELISGNP